jgi:anaerobic ribonucleoside-triphosphate reductase activating protein
MAVRDGVNRGRPLEGVTFQGGEPFEQAEALAALARPARDLGLGLLVFSGYRLEDLEKEIQPGSRALLEQTDLLVDGPYRRGRPPGGRPWIGSGNQRFHFLSPRYEGLRNRLFTFKNSMEIHFDGREITWNGFPDLAKFMDRVLR